MADAKSNYAENLVAQWMLTTNSVTRPTAWYVALFTTDPAEAGSGTEVTGGSYARQSVTFSVTNNTASNTGIITFSSMPAATVTHFGLYDASTSGNLLYYGALTSSRTTQAGDDAEFAVGTLTISEL
jgi:hypothetical protein